MEKFADLVIVDEEGHVAVAKGSASRLGQCTVNIDGRALEGDCSGERCVGEVIGTWLSVELALKEDQFSCNIREKQCGAYSGIVPCIVVQFECRWSGGTRLATSASVPCFRRDI